MREIVLDTETTGLSPDSGHRVVEIGCVELVNHLPTGRTYWQYVNPERSMPSEAYNVHGLSEEFLADKPVFADIAEAFAGFVDGADLIIHNAAFDMAFLRAEFERAARPPLPAGRIVDTLDIARRKHPAGPNSLDALCRRYGVDNSNRVRHGALLDCELLAEVYLELVGGRQPHLTLVETRVQAEVALVRKPARVRPAPLPPRLSEEEATAHRAFVETLSGQAVWRLYEVCTDIGNAPDRA